MKTQNINNLFLQSALTEANPAITTNEVIQWLHERNRATKVNIEPISFSELKQWSFSKEKGKLLHNSGKFFSIDGISVSTNWGETPYWEQPIINQPEIGILGIISKKINGILYFLLQAKIEPGNVNHVQLAPTLQATKSNYTQAHKGSKPLYLDYFTNTSNTSLLDQLQSEQGARFLRKRNRNIIIMVDEDIPVYDNFIWLSLGQIKALLKIDNIVNMDTRTVISGIPFGRYNSDTINLFKNLSAGQFTNKIAFNMLQSALDISSAYHTYDVILNWLTALKIKYELVIEKKSIFNLDQWFITDKEINHKDNKFFKIIAAKVDIENREVSSWTQPIVQPIHPGLIAFITKKINGIYHFLVQAKLECGNFDILEMAPTVQCITDSYDVSEDLPFLNYVLSAKKEQIISDTMQSEEGGRFYKEQNRNLIIDGGDDFPIDVPENYIWVSLNQLNMFLKFNNYLNIQTRSLIASIAYK